MSLKEELDELELEIQSLRNEISPLQENHDQLFREVSVFEAENKHKNFAKPTLPKRMTRSPAETYLDLDDTPPLIHHTHFDASIEKYFTDNHDVSNVQDVSTNDDILARIHHKTKAGKAAVREGILRFAGTTAFAINDRLYDSEDDALLGLRFDVMSHTTLKFLKPHYIILRRRQYSKILDSSPSSWLVFRYTTPSYVLLDQFREFLLDSDESAGLQNFVEGVRRLLITVQYRHDQFDRLSALSYREVFDTDLQVHVINNLERDLECRRVHLTIKSRDKSNGKAIGILLVCDIEELESVECTLGDENLKSFIQGMLQGCSIQKLRSTFVEVFRYMRKNDLI